MVHHSNDMILFKIRINDILIWSYCKSAASGNDSTKISKHSFQKIRQEMYVYFIMPYQVKKVIRITATIERKQEFELCIK